MARFWHQRIADLSVVTIGKGKQEQRRRLVNGFSAIELRGTEKSGTVPSSVCAVANSIIIKRKRSMGNMAYTS